MILAAIERRLAKIEEQRGFAPRGDVRLMADAQLAAYIRRAYADLRDKHGSLAAAVAALSATGNEDDAALAILIAEDIGGADARIH